jgi:hypothetical protein
MDWQGLGSDATQALELDSWVPMKLFPSPLGNQGKFSPRSEPSFLCDMQMLTPGVGGGSLEHS